MHLNMSLSKCRPCRALNVLELKFMAEWKMICWNVIVPSISKSTLAVNVMEKFHNR